MSDHRVDAETTNSPLPKTMLAAVYYDREDIRIETVSVPSPGPGELLLRTGTVGVCGSDAGEFTHGPSTHPVKVMNPFTHHLGPIIPGHEFSGTVVDIGKGVDQGWIGAMVASCGSVCCGVCAACRRGESNLCVTYNGVGLQRNGALAGYVTTPAAASVDVKPFGLSLDEAALCQPMAIAVHNVRRAGNVDGQTVLLIGAGGIGAFLVYVLKQLGALVVAVDRDAQRLTVASELGADITVLVDGRDDEKTIRNTAGDVEFRVIIEATGSASALTTAFDIAPKGARIVAVGLQHTPTSLDLARFTLTEKTLIGTNAMVRETDFPFAVELVSRRRGGWGLIAPTVLPLQDLVDGAIRPMVEGRAIVIKALIDPWTLDQRPSTKLADNNASSND
ncbi:zinc-binding dehydrogenase [Glaciihabitans sp. UYNi722]|uniref:zinc-dependent alcohol dehydrogenase n=1 Tax=Glaciihabitans sp. UYNi722 TaxID=3156344 RepID=UPI003395D826